MECGCAAGLGPTGSGTGGGGSDGGTTTTVTAGSTTSTGEFGTSSSVTGAGGGCVAKQVKAEHSPLDMIIFLDESASMQGTKWTSATGALDAFVSDPASGGIAVGLDVFPATGAGSQVCYQSAYQSLLVPLGTLPQNQSALTTAIAAQSPQGDTTPLAGAFSGAIYVATQQKTAHPDHAVVVLFATDGVATCITNQDVPLTQSASQALAQNNIMTFTIALQGADLSQLNAVAQAGGTNQAYDLTTNPQQFSQKLNDIRGKVLPCDVLIPPPPQGEQLDPTKVNVVYTPGGATTGQNIPHVMSASDCGGDPGWYYDDVNAPTKVLFCPTTCTTVKGDAAATVDVAFGCQTILK
jgi:hypothetical protein